MTLKTNTQTGPRALLLLNMRVPFEMPAVDTLFSQQM
jgi:hypothetical protein